MKIIFVSHMGLHDGMDRTGYVGAFIPGQDIVVPPLQPRVQVEQMLLESPLVRGSRRWDGTGGVDGFGRTTTLFFAGSVKPLRPNMDCPPRDETRSCNVRKAIISQFSDTEGFHLFNHSTPDYHKQMVESHFCLGVSGVGGGWGRRHSLAVMHGCIPVMIMDGSSLELDELIPWDKMSVRVAEKDIDKLPQILNDVMADTQRMRNMRAELACVWPRFLWSSIEGSHAGEDGSDDAFASLMEILRRRLGGRGAGDTAEGAFRGDEDDANENENVNENEGGGADGGADGVTVGDVGEGEELSPPPLADIRVSESGPPALDDDDSPPPAAQTAAAGSEAAAAKNKKTKKAHETSPGWHPAKKTKNAKASATKRKSAAGAGKKGGAAKRETTRRFRKLLEGGSAAAADESSAGGPAAVVKPMPSACTRSRQDSSTSTHSRTRLFA